MQFNFDDIHVPAEKLNMVVGQDLYTIKRQYRKRKLRKYIMEGMAAAAIALSAAGIFATNPVLAAKLPLIGHIFEQVQDEQRYPGNFDEVSEPLTEGNVSTSQGITMTLSEIYCNSNAIYVSAIIESDEPFPEEVKESNMLGDSDVGYYMYLENEQEYDFMETPSSYDEYERPDEQSEWNRLDLKGEYVDDHTFIGATRIDFNFYPFGSYDIPDTFHWKLKVNNIKVISEADPRFSQDGTWEFETEVSVDQTKPTVIEVNENAPNGDVIQSITMTPYEAHVDFGYDESKVQDGYESYDSLARIMLDADGKEIRNKVGFFSPVGYNLSKITVYYFPTPTEEAWLEIQENLMDPAVQEHLKDYMEEISIHTIEIDLN